MAKVDHPRFLEGRFRSGSLLVVLPRSELRVVDSDSSC